MAIKEHKNGTYTIATEKDAKAALVEMEEISAKAVALSQKHGIDKLYVKATELKKAATAFLVSKQKETLKLGNGRYARVQQSFERVWILTADDVDSLPEGAKPLMSILKKKFPDKKERQAVVNAITKRVIDPEGLAAAIEDGILKEKWLAPALIEKPRAPYVRLYNEAADDDDDEA